LIRVKLINEKSGFKVDLMKFNFCLPLVVDSVEEVDSTLKKHLLEGEFSFAEVWLDHIELNSTFNFEELFNWSQKLAQTFTPKLIFVFRRLALAATKLTTDQRLQLIKEIAKSNNLIDLDIFDQQQELITLKDKQERVNLICSYHNYSKTPPIDDLLKIVAEMKTFKPQIYKLACFCESDEDSLRLMDLQQQLIRKELKSVVLGMGERGKITRITNTLWGNELVFAPLLGIHETAPNQLTLDDYKSILSVFTSKIYI
jgi:3-dehydroquinate dehydratase type I